ncbi:MAG: ribosome small subunit-dependent GTPase A [Clostridia bacterium]|nr:ribosome small subunit-dependent GTPase A [Clostridia bacterium]
MTGLIVKAIAGFYYVETENGVFECRARGKFRKNDEHPLVGDRVEITLCGSSGTVDRVIERKNCLLRPPVANIDRLYIVSAYTLPSPDFLMIDRLTVIAETSGIEPIIVFNKCDLGDFEPYSSVYEKAGFRTFVVSCETGENIDLLKADLADGISVFTGNSGVGKTSILNHILDGVDLATGEVSERLGRGRHTTRHVELFKTVGGGYIADTPGFSSIENDTILKEDLALYFSDFEDYRDECRFVGCSHTCEKGCAVIAAVESGKIMPTRHESYISMYEKAKLIKEWELKKQ